jgi:hypothetical protein
MDHILILKYCNFVSVSLDSDTRPLMIPVCTAHPSPLMLRALGLESYLKLRTCKASSLVQLSHLDHFVFQDSLLFEFSIFTLHLDLDAEFCGQLISLGVVHIVRPSQLLLRRMQLLMQCLHFCLLQCANLLHKLWVAAVEVEWWWLLVWLLLVWLLLVVGRLLVVSRLLVVARLLVLLVVARLLVLLVVDSVLVLLVVARMLVVAKWCTMLLLLLASQVILLMVIARLVPLLTRLAPLFIRLVPLAIRPITLLTMVTCHLAGVWLYAVPCNIIM